MRIAAENVFGYYHSQRNNCYEQECTEASAAKDATQRDTLQSASKRTVHEIYRDLRRLLTPTEAQEA